MNSLDLMKKRVSYYGDDVSSDQFTRMREDKLRSMKKALYYSYQAAVVQKYDAFEPVDAQTSNYFRCLINHDKLKVDYEDKIISIPFKENSVSIDPVKDNQDLLETNFHNGTVFTWIHGNKEEWVPDTHWIVYMQYSEETAYFRGEIRQADEEIIIVDVDGNEHKYFGWTSGPDEKSILWNVKKGIVWNNMNYTKLLYITKDATTTQFFKRFDRVYVNGKPWEVQAYNDNYGASSNNKETGIIRVALKETYTNTDDVIKQKDEEDAAAPEIRLEGPDVLAPYDTATYSVVGAPAAAWILKSGGSVPIDELVSYTIDGNNLNLEVIYTKTYRKGFDIINGDNSIHVSIVTV